MMNRHRLLRDKAIRVTLATALAGLAILVPGSGGRSLAAPLIDPIEIFQPTTTAYSYYYHYAWYDHIAPSAAGPVNLSDPLIGPGIPLDQDLRALM
jgi:hypothetical protein